MLILVNCLFLYELLNNEDLFFLLLMFFDSVFLHFLPRQHLILLAESLFFLVLSASVSLHPHPPLYISYINKEMMMAQRKKKLKNTNM